VPNLRTIILSLADPPASGEGDGCGTNGTCGSLCGTNASDPDPRSCSSGGPRVPVLECRDALAGAGHDVELVTATSDHEIDAVIGRLDGVPRADGLIWPALIGEAPTLIVAVESDGQLRAIVRRMVRRYAPAPSKRPADLADGRTMPNLPPIGILPLQHDNDLADRLGLPRDGADVAKAVLSNRAKRVDLFRNDGGSITLHGAILGGVDSSGSALPWVGAVTVDDKVLADGNESILAVAVANGSGYAHLDEIALVPLADPSSGVLAAAVAVPIVTRSLLGRVSMRIEVRRASGRAVSVTPRDDVPFSDDGVNGVLTRKRSWWIEPGAWGVFTG
jgi:hypothetical protein